MFRELMALALYRGSLRISEQSALGTAAAETAHHTQSTGCCVRGFNTQTNEEMQNQSQKYLPDRERLYINASFVLNVTFYI